jgi:hypothetical protein
VLLVALATCLLAVPAVARAQSAIAGVVKDTSGAVLPGVTVEASSDALIEKTRVATTDGSGQYKIVDLRPGAYVVTFTLPGFQTIKRDGIDLPSEFTATINADLKVGSIEETITVTTAAPVVDVQSAAHTQVLDRESIDNLPTGRTIQGIGQMVVGVSLSLPDVGGSRAAMQTYMSVRGNSAANNTILVDGMVVNGLEADGAVQSYFNDAMAQEMSYQTSGIDASVSAGGVKLNMIPKEGGNRFNGSAQVSYRPGAWQGNNLTPRLQSAGVTANNVTDYIYDLSGSQGGPIAKDRLWFFAAARDYRTNNGVTNTFFDGGSQGKDYNYIRDALGRLTWQMNQKTRIGGYYDRISKFRGHDMQSLYDPETASNIWTSPNYSTGSIKVTSTITSRLLLEGGWALNVERRNTEMQDGIEQDRGTAAWLAGATHALASNTLGGAAGSAFTAGSQWPVRYSYNGSLSYITGSHHLKGGFNGTYGSFYHETRANADLYQEYANVITTNYTNGGGDLIFQNPRSVVVRNTPVTSGEALDLDLGLYAQDTYTLNRITLSAGIRYEMLNASVQGLTAPAGRFVPERTVQELTGQPDWKNWAPRFQAVYDVFGNSKTAIKYSFNRYNQSRTTGIASGFNTLSSTTARINWTDVNGDDIAQGARTWNNGVKSDCAPYPSVGCEIDLSQLSSTFGIVSDSGSYLGFPRQYSLEQGIEVQHELLPRLSITGTYYRGEFNNLTTTINRNICGVVSGCAPTTLFPGGVPYSYEAVQIFNPIDGTPMTVYNQLAGVSTRAAANETFVDPDRKQIFDSYSAEFRLRAGRGATLFGGMSWGRTRQSAYGTAASTNNCTVGSLQNPNLLRFCDEFNLEDGTTVPYGASFRLNGSYPLPWYGIIVSGTFQSNDDGGLAQSYTITPTTRYPDGTATYLVANQPAPACASPCTPGSLVLSTLRLATQSIPLRNDESVRGERLNQVDLKIGKTFKVGSMTIAPNLEIFNLTNIDKVITYGSTSYAISTGTYLKPNSITQGRIIGVGTSVRW